MLRRLLRKFAAAAEAGAAHRALGFMELVDAVAMEHVPARQRRQPGRQRVPAYRAVHLRIVGLFGSADVFNFFIPKFQFFNPRPSR